MRYMALAMVICVFSFCGTAPAGEENILAMRGQPPVGSKALNHVSAVRSGGMEEMAAPVPVRIPAWTAPVSKSLPSMRYVGWKEASTRTHIALPDKTVEWSGKIGFAMTPRFVDRQHESVHESFFLTLLRILDGNLEK